MKIYKYIIKKLYQQQFHTMKILQRYRNLSTSKQIGLTVALNFLVVLTIITLTLMFVFNNIQTSQQQMPQLFFNSYDAYSLQETTTLVKQLIITTIDFRSSFIGNLANIIKANLTKPNSLTSQNTQQLYNQNSTSYCFFTSSNTTIFSCMMDIYTKFVMEEGWPFQTKRPCKRFNIIYQNKNNQNDIMIKTIPFNPQFSISNTSIITSKMNKINDSNISFSTFYYDKYVPSNQSLVSFDIKLQFDNYNVLLEIETYGSQITKPLTRVLYSDDTNVAVLALNSNVPIGYQMVASYKPLDPNINFTKLLEIGFKKTKVNNISILSYTTPISSAYYLGSINYAKNSTMINSNYVVIVYAPSISGDMETTVFGFITNLLYSLKKIQGVLLVILIAAASVLLMHSIGDIGKNLKIFLEVIKQYTTSMGNYDQVVNCKNEKIYPLMRSNSVLRIINLVIKTIEYKKRDFKRKCSHIKYDKFPSNTFNQQFQKKQNIKDFQKFQQIYEKLKQKINDSQIKIQKKKSIQI